MRIAIVLFGFAVMILAVTFVIAPAIERDVREVQLQKQERDSQAQIYCRQIEFYSVNFELCHRLGVRP